MTTRRLASLAPSVLAVFGCVDTASAQCAMCGNSFGQNDPTVTAFNASVLFMMLAPYTIFFAAAGVLVFLYRRGLLGRRAPVIPLSRGRSQTSPKEVTP